MNRKFPDKWLIWPILVLGVYFIIRLINQSKMIKMFPLDFVNDYSSHVAELFFLKVCGFHNLCPYWYNGFYLFKSYVPGWFFYATPMYWATGDPLLATFLSLILLLVLLFFALILIGKQLGFSKVKVIAFFLLLFANPMAIGNFIRLGRVTELFGWFSFFLLAYIIFKYKDRKLDSGFLFFIPFYAILMISHLAVMVISQFFILSLFLVKGWKERFIIVLSSIAGFGLASFWTIPYIKDLSVNNTLSYAFGRWLLDFGPELLLTNIATIIVGIFLWFTFYYYWKSTKFNKRELLFYSPVIGLSLLTTLRISPFLPFLKHLYPDPLMFFYLFFAFIFLFRTNMKVYNSWLRTIIKISFTLVPIGFVIVSIWYTPWFTEPGPVEEQVLESLNYVDGRFLLTPSPYPNSYSRAYYSYAPIYHDLSTADGWAGVYISGEYWDDMKQFNQAVKEDDCEFVQYITENYNVDNIISYDIYCPLMKECGFTEVWFSENVCVFET